jgi:hypothetical protein
VADHSSPKACRPDSPRPTRLKSNSIQHLNHPPRGSICTVTSGDMFYKAAHQIASQDHKIMDTTMVNVNRYSIPPPSSSMLTCHVQQDCVTKKTSISCNNAIATPTTKTPWSSQSSTIKTRLYKIYSLVSLIDYADSRDPLLPLSSTCLLD